MNATTCQNTGAAPLTSSRKSRDHGSRRADRARGGRADGELTAALIFPTTRRLVSNARRARRSARRRRRRAASVPPDRRQATGRRPAVKSHRPGAPAGRHQAAAAAIATSWSIFGSSDEYLMARHATTIATRCRTYSSTWHPRRRRRSTWTARASARPTRRRRGTASSWRRRRSGEHGVRNVGKSAFVQLVVELKQCENGAARARRPLAEAERRVADTRARLNAATAETAEAVALIERASPSAGRANRHAIGAAAPRVRARHRGGGGGRRRGGGGGPRRPRHLRRPTRCGLLSRGAACVRAESDADDRRVGAYALRRAAAANASDAGGALASIGSARACARAAGSPPSSCLRVLSLTAALPDHASLDALLPDAARCRGVGGGGGGREGGGGSPRTAGGKAAGGCGRRSSRPERGLMCWLRTARRDGCELWLNGFISAATRRRFWRSECCLRGSRRSSSAAREQRRRSSRRDDSNL